MKNPNEMTKKEIDRELEKYAWNYIAIADLARSDEQYLRLVSEADSRKKALLAALEKLEKKPG